MATYAEKPTSFEEMVAPFDADVRSTADALRALIRATLPDFNEDIYGGLSMANALYSRGGPNNVICGIQPARDHCKLYVHNVADLRWDGLRIEGSGKNARHVKVRSLDDHAVDLLARLLHTARQRSGH